MDYGRFANPFGAEPSRASNPRKSKLVYRVQGTADRYADRNMMFGHSSATISRNVDTRDEAIAVAERFVETHPPEGRSARVWVEEHNPRTGDSTTLVKWEGEHGKGWRLVRGGVRQFAKWL